MKHFQLTSHRFSRMRFGQLCLGLVSLIGALGWSIAAGKIETAAAQAPSVVVVNAASFATDILAPDSMAAAFGSFATTGGQTFTAPSTQLPSTLGGVRVTVNGIDAGLIVVSPTQINFVLPANLPDGANSVVVTNSDSTTRATTITIQRAAPGIFTTRGTGFGAAAALVTSDGVNFQATSNPDGSEREINAGTSGRPTYLILYATGVRNAAAINPNDGNGVAEAVTATIQGVPAQVVFAGRASGFAGLDQINLIVPPQLSGLGSLRVRLNIAGRVSNAPTVLVGGTPPVIQATPITAGAGIFGVLSTDDQLQGAGDGSGRTYYFDAYRLTTTAANTTVAIDLRSVQFNAVVAIAQQRTEGSLNFLASDDNTGGLGNGALVNDNALLLTVLRDPGNYLIVVTSADTDPNATGGYQLTVTTDALQAITYGTTTTGATISNTDLVTSAGDRLDAYWFAGAPGDVVQIRMTSAAFDSFLILNAENGNLVEFDDNSGGGAQGQDSQLTKTLTESGNYVILATPFEPARTGAYTLSLNRLNPTALAALAGSEFLTTVPGRTLSPINGAEDRDPHQTQFDRVASRHFITNGGQ
jgi:uncharacterized protein (TIGR03437 family)